MFSCAAGFLVTVGCFGLWQLAGLLVLGLRLILLCCYDLLLLIVLITLILCCCLFGLV